MNTIYSAGAKQPTDHRPNVMEHSIIDGKYVTGKPKYDGTDIYVVSKEGKVRRSGSFIEYGEMEIIATISPTQLEGVPMIQLPDEDELLHKEGMRLALIDNEYCKEGNHSMDCECTGFAEGYVKGYKAAPSKGVWTDNDMLKMWEQAQESATGTDNFPMAGNTFKYPTAKEYLASLKQPKTIQEIELEMGDKGHQEKVNPEETIPTKHQYKWVEDLHLKIHIPNDRGGIITPINVKY